MRRRRLACPAVILLVAVAAGLGPWSAPAARAGGSLGPPTKGWDPFSNDSFWNTPISPGALVDPNSNSIIAYLKTDNSPDYLQLSGVGSTGSWGVPVYWAVVTDPRYDVTNQTGCPDQPPEFDSMRIPLGALPDS